MELALADAGLTSDEVDAVVAHGTGTVVGDAAEITALNELFGGRSVPIAVTSVKGHVGHTAGAAGVMNLFATLRSMADGALVPAAGTKNLDPSIEFIVPIGGEAHRRDIAVSQINGFGFGGQDASVVLSRD